MAYKFTFEARNDGGENVDDSRGKSWAVYPPHVIPTRKLTVYNGVLPTGTQDAPLWADSNLWTACLRLPAYKNPPWKLLASAPTKEKLMQQIEWFGEGDPDLVVTADRGNGLAVVIALVLLWALDK